jgi:hypothetical protein
MAKEIKTVSFVCVLINKSTNLPLNQCSEIVMTVLLLMTDEYNMHEVMDMQRKMPIFGNENVYYSQTRINKEKN